MIERARIQAVLNRFRPTLQADGADIELIDVESAGASVGRLTGLCGRCAAAPLSVHDGFSEILRQEIPGFGELRLV